MGFLIFFIRCPTGTEHPWSLKTIHYQKGVLIKIHITLSHLEQRSYCQLNNNLLPAETKGENGLYWVRAKSIQHLALSQTELYRTHFKESLRLAKHILFLPHDSLLASQDVRLRKLFKWETMPLSLNIIIFFFQKFAHKLQSSTVAYSEESHSFTSYD